MSWIRRIGFFIVLNVVVVTTISLVVNLLGIGPAVTANGLNLGSLFALCLVWGMGGSFISLLLSRVMAKWTMGVQIIDPNTNDPEARRIINTVYRLAQQAGLTTMPEVGFYDSPEVNAFATGPTKRRSLVAVSTGLFRQMDQKSIDGVLGHEITHIVNGDMVTMTLLQGVVNAFVMALARIVAFAIDNALRGDRDNGRGGGGLGYFGYVMVVWVLEILFFIPGSFVIGWFSRQREFRADAGGARLAGRDNMISALRNLQRVHELNSSAAEQAQAGSNRSQSIAALKIAGGRTGVLAALSATHPPLEERIARLQQLAI